MAVGKAKRIFKVKFTALFNEKWSAFLSREMGVGWNLEVGFYTPSFWKQVTQVVQ